MQADRDMLRIQRAKKKMTKVELEAKTGINRKQISLYEDDVYKCPIKNLLIIAEALEFDPKKIFLDQQSQNEK